MRILCIDFDDVIFNTKPAVEAILSKIKKEATSDYFKEIVSTYGKQSEEFKIYSSEHFDYKDRILEEVDDEYKGLIDYDAIFSSIDIFPGTIGYINYLLNCGRYDKVYILSHCNIQREIDAKEKFLNRFFPDLELIAVPYHLDKYAPNLVRRPTSKAEYFMKKKEISDLTKCTLIDDSNTNCEDWRKHGGIAIKYNASGIINYENRDVNTLNPLSISVIEDDHVGRLMAPEEPSVKRR